MMSDGEAEGSAQGALGGGARGRCTESATRAARSARIRSMRSGASMHAITRSVPPHTGQCLMSMWKQTDPLGRLTRWLRQRPAPVIGGVRNNQ